MLSNVLKINNFFLKKASSVPRRRTTDKPDGYIFLLQQKERNRKDMCCTFREGVFENVCKTGFAKPRELKPEAPPIHQGGSSISGRGSNLCVQ